MSKQLKTILEHYGNYSARHYAHNPDVADMSIDEAVDELKELMLELIGEDEDAGVFEDGTTGEVIQNLEAFAHNNLRADLRAKVEAL